MIRPKVSPEDLSLFQQLATRAKANGDGVITRAEYERLERIFIARQGEPGSPVVFWGWGHQAILKRALAQAGVQIEGILFRCIRSL